MHTLIAVAAMMPNRIDILKMALTHEWSLRRIHQEMIKSSGFSESHKKAIKHHAKNIRILIEELKR